MRHGVQVMSIYTVFMELGIRKWEAPVLSIWGKEMRKGNALPHILMLDWLKAEEGSQVHLGTPSNFFSQPVKP